MGYAGEIANRAGQVAQPSTEREGVGYHGVRIKDSAISSATLYREGEITNLQRAALCKSFSHCLKDKIL